MNQILMDYGFEGELLNLASKVIKDEADFNQYLVFVTINENRFLTQLAMLDGYRKSKLQEQTTYVKETVTEYQNTNDISSKVIVLENLLLTTVNNRCILLLDKLVSKGKSLQAILDQLLLAKNNVFIELKMM